MTIELIAIDLDGTLLTDDKELTQENYQALHRAHEAGLKIVICTGRPYLGMKFIVDEIGLTSSDDYIITFNGSLIQKAQDGQILYENTLSMDDLRQWYQATQAVDLPLTALDLQMIYESDQQPQGHESIYTAQIAKAPSTTVDLLGLPEENRFNKLLIAVEEAYLDQQLALIPQELKDDYEMVKSHPYLMEISQPNVSKGIALGRLSELLDIPLERMMGIGDERNDLSMIEEVGLGVAMANAVPEVKELADWITGDNNSSGVAQAIHRYLDKE